MNRSPLYIYTNRRDIYECRYNERESAVWRYLGQKYGLRDGGIVDDGDGPPMLVIESIN